MAKYHGKNMSLYVGGYNIGALVAGLTPVMEMSMLPYAVADLSGGYHYQPDIAKDAMSLDGIFDDNYMAVLTALYGPSAPPVAGYGLMIPLGINALDQALCCNSAWMQNYKVKAAAKDLNKITGEFVVDTLGWEECKMLQQLATKTTSSNGTAVNEVASSANGAVAFLQVTDIGADDTLAVTIEHSSDNFAADTATLITFAVVNGAVAVHNAQRVAASGTVKQYVRVKWVLGGVSTYTATFAVGWLRL